jgi:cyanamide hydratase
MTSQTNPAIALYGWQAVPSDLKTLLKQHSEANGSAPTYTVSQLALPDSELAKAVHEYAKKELPRETFNHSMRVWCYGTSAPPIIPLRFPQYRFNKGKDVQEESQEKV